LDQIKDSISFQIYAQDRSIERLTSEHVTVRVFKTTLQLLPPYFRDFPNPPEIYNVSESIERGTTLKNFTAVIQTNPSDQFIRCFLSPKPNPEWFKFELADSQATLSKSQTCILKVEDPLNYRVASSMVIYMIAEIGNTRIASTARELKILTINLKEENINPPKFVTSTIEASVVEGKTDIGKVIAVVKAYDLDITSPLNDINYSFDVNSNFDKYFAINSITGEIKMIKEIKNKKNIPLQVIAQDGANGFKRNVPNQNTIYINIKVLDINDNPPRFVNERYDFNVSEGADLKSVIGSVDVYDDDNDSFFDFSISESTFGIRKFFSLEKAGIYNSSYKGSAEIYLNRYLDFYKTNKYNFKIFVSDSMFSANADVSVNIINANNKPPLFTNTPYTIDLTEASLDENKVLLTLTATGVDTQSKDFYYQIYSTPYLDKNWFDLDSNSGALRLIKPLDYDLPNGRPVFSLPISVAYKNSQNLKTYSKVSINLKDLNDNRPFLIYDKQPLIINEGQIEQVYVYVSDIDQISSKPYNFQLTNNNDNFELSTVPNCAECSTSKREKYSIENKVPFDRSQQKSFILNYVLGDGIRPDKTGSFEIIVGDINNNPHSDGSKVVRIISYQNNIQSDTFLGTLYAKDKDDWDKNDKEASDCSQTPDNAFEIRQGLEIYGIKRSPQSFLSLECKIKDVTQPKINNVKAKVDFNIDNVDYSDLIDLAGIRFIGITAEDLAMKLDTETTSYLDSIQLNLMNILNLDPKQNGRDDILRIVTLRNYKLNVKPSSLFDKNEILNYNESSFGADIYFFARKNGRLMSSREIYHLISTKIDLLSNLNDKNYSNVLLLFNICEPNECSIENPNMKCRQTFIKSSQSVTIDANATAIVGMNNQLISQCYCNNINSNANSIGCFNGGTQYKSNGASDFYCDCPKDFNGPRCEHLSLQFGKLSQSTALSQSRFSHSFAIFEPFEMCDLLRFEFEFSTANSEGLLLFNGAINRNSLYFIGLEIFKGILFVHIGGSNVSFPFVNVSDRYWHKVDVSMSLDAVQVNLDDCQSKSLVLTNYKQMMDDRLPTDNITLILGGMSPSVSGSFYYFKILNVFEYNGCLRNFKVNGEFRDLTLKQNSFNLASNENFCDCNYNIQCSNGPIKNSLIRTTEFPWWIILIIAAVLAILATILGFAVFSIRRKDNKKKLLDIDDDIRETIINYADGAGEENTENYNIGIIQKPVGPIIQSMPLVSASGASGSSQRPEAIPNDQNMIYAYEGEGSDAGSLSSIGSDMSDNDHNFDYLQEWGPKFSKLSDLYQLGNNNNNANTSPNTPDPTVENQQYQNRAYDSNGERNRNKNMN
jgi:hypothetical protein